MIKVKFTAERYTPADIEHGAPSEQGWADPRTVNPDLFGYPEEAPEFEFDSRDEAMEYITAQIGPVTSNGRDSFYADDSVEDMVTGNKMNFAAHINSNF